MLVYLLCDITFLREIQHVHLPTARKEPITDPSMDTTKFQFGKTMGFIGVTYRNMEEGLLARIQMIQRQLHLQSLHQQKQQFPQLKKWSMVNSLSEAQ